MGAGGWCLFELLSTVELPTKEFMYISWFRDTWTDETEQDHEWCACFIIKAESSSDAKLWGDHLAKYMCKRNDQQKYLWSEAHSRKDPMYSEKNWKESPVVLCGEYATDDYIGW